MHLKPSHSLYNQADASPTVISFTHTNIQCSLLELPTMHFVVIFIWLASLNCGVNSLYLNRMFDRVHAPQSINYQERVVIPSISQHQAKLEGEKGNSVSLNLRPDNADKAQMTNNRFSDRIGGAGIEAPDLGEYFGLPLLSRDPHVREWEYASNIGTDNKLNMRY